MISFIVIGRNEGCKLTNCLESIFNVINLNNLTDSDIIYVDSKSTDDSIERASKFKDVKIFSIDGDCNAAIARNIGAKESLGNLLFFIDGDMEIEASFIKNVSGNIFGNEAICIAGHLDDIFYDSIGVYLGQHPRTYRNSIPKEPIELLTNGGIFIIRKELWEKVGSMRTKFKHSQDMDFTIRLSNHGIKTVRFPYFIAKHHTIDYRNEKRMWKMLLSGYDFYPALLFKYHILNFNLVRRTFRSHYTAFSFLILVISLAFNASLSITVGAIFASLILSKVIIHTNRAVTKRNKILYFCERLLLQVLRDISFLFAIFFFFPREKKIEYSQIQ